MHASPRTALLVGATGLVGRELLRQLLADPRYGAVTVLARRSAGVKHDKLTEHLVDFDRPDDWHALAKGDHLFSALGTTLKAAGSREAQYRVDYTYQYEVARAARHHGTETYVLVSSTGAAAKSAIFYSRMKGELERDAAALGFRARASSSPARSTATARSTAPASAGPCGSSAPGADPARRGATDRRRHRRPRGHHRRLRSHARRAPPRRRRPVPPRQPGVTATAS
ncbi:NAD-dependent epimerase/dehydratase family protein [Nannocystis pusilla]|uniref:NAD-dependent epimerase/dehydratase family protein n=1 Tax=Nannocystis pusilla TaxID=889268 RepID=UPI003B7DB7DF